MKIILIFGIIFNLLLCKEKITSKSEYGDRNAKDVANNLFVFAEGGLNLRSEPSISSKKSGFINDGEFVKFLSKDKKDTVNGSEGNWCKIQFKDTIGYAFSSYLHENVIFEKEKFSPSKKYSYKLFRREDSNCEWNGNNCYTIIFQNNQFVKSFHGVIDEWKNENEITYKIQGRSDDESYVTRKSYNFQSKKTNLIRFSRDINPGWYGGIDKVSEKFLSGLVTCNESLCYIFLEDKENKIHLYNSILNPQKFDDSIHYLLQKPEQFIGKSISEDISRKENFFSLHDSKITFSEDTNGIKFLYYEKSYTENDSTEPVEIYYLQK